jgi:hypothetical protein
VTTNSCRPRPPGLPSAGADQAQLRAARRARYAHTYTGDFSLLVEVVDQCLPLAHRVAARPNPEHYAETVDELIDAVHAATSRIAAMIARAAAERRTATLPVDARGAAIRRLINATPRPPRPAIAAKALTSGAWARRVIEPARPYSPLLAELLASAAPDRRGAPTVSEQLEAALRWIDTAALALQRKLDAAESRPAVKAPHHVEPTTQDQCRIARRAKLPFSWPVGFDLEAEISAICDPLAAAVAGMRDPGSAAKEVNGLIDTVRDAIAEFANLTTRADAAKRTAHVPVDQRGAAKRLVLDLAPPPPTVRITEAQLVEGDWAGMLAELAAPYGAPLSQLLTADARIGGESVSDRLEVRLTQIDRAATSLARRIDAVAQRRHRGPAVAVPAVAPANKAEAARAELARLGVALP